MDGSGQAKRERFCVIPARGGSKRLKRKNLALFRGKTLVAHTVTQAKESGVFDHVILSSEDPEILEEGKALGVELHVREAGLATDTVKIVDVIRTLVATRPIPGDAALCVLLTTCPLREVRDIRGAYDVFERGGFRHPVVSVKRNEYPVQMCWRKEGDHLTPLFPEEFGRSTRKQDHFDTYSYNDAVIFDTAAAFAREGRNLYGEDPLPYEMPWERSVPIDYEFQLRIAQLLGEEANHAAV